MRLTEVVIGLSDFLDQDSYVQSKPAAAAATTNVTQLLGLGISLANFGNNQAQQTDCIETFCARPGKLTQLSGIGRYYVKMYV